jgi:hypothetical protein
MKVDRASLYSITTTWAWLAIFLNREKRKTITEMM